EDDVEGILLALATGQPGEKFNVGGGNERTNLQIVDLICDALDELRPRPNGYRALKTFVPDRPGHDRRYAIDAKKIRRELGWQPRYDFDSGIAKTIDWYLENGEWCRKVLQGKYGRERLGLKEEVKQ